MPPRAPRQRLYRTGPTAFAPVLFAVLAMGPAPAQPPVAPTNLPVGITRGDNTTGYNVRQSFELGYRYHSVGGSEDMYRSTVNFGNGIRLLSTSLSIHSLEGQGNRFDHIQLDTQGLGNDPYQFARLRVEKNRLYRYDLNWRSNAYYNPGVRTAAGQHSIDTVRNWQDHDFTLFPQSGLKFFAGFSRNAQSGPALTTTQLFSTRGDEYPLFADIRRKQHEYRVGFELNAAGFRFNLMHGWVDFKDDTPVRLPAASPGNNPDDPAALDQLRRAEPYHGNSPYWRIALFKEEDKWALNGRFTYVAGRRSFVQDELAAGSNFLGAATTRQIVTLGYAQRPAITGNLNLIAFPSDRVTLTNQTSIYHIRMQGDALFTQLDNGVPATPFLPFSFLGIRTISNSTDLDWRATPWFAVRAGYQYSTRRIRSMEGADVEGSDLSPRSVIEQTNGLHTALLGLRFRPVRPLTITIDGELGRADRPIYPISQRNYQNARARIQYTGDSVRLAAYARGDYNTNSASLANFASRSRQYGADLTWTVSRSFFVDLSYAKLHLDSLGAMTYFAEPAGGGPVGQVSTDRSYYISNLHTANLAARFNLGRVELSLGLSHVQDTGDGRSSRYGGELQRLSGSSGSPGAPPTGVAAVNPFSRNPAFAAAQTFPLRFTSPQGRVSVRISENVRWNLGYQHYGYHEQFGAQDPQYADVEDLIPLAPLVSQNYRAHTGYSSVSWSF